MNSSNRRKTVVMRKTLVFSEAFTRGGRSVIPLMSSGLMDTNGAKRESNDLMACCRLSELAMIVVNSSGRSLGVVA